MADEKIINSLTHLTAWIDQNGFAGWDPYDIKSKKHARTNRTVNH
jgi:hypothetical protein